jgi:hypothetical protein
MSKSIAAVESSNTDSCAVGETGIMGRSRKPFFKQSSRLHKRLGTVGKLVYNCQGNGLLSTFQLFWRQQFNLLSLGAVIIIQGNGSSRRTEICHEYGLT